MSTVLLLRVGVVEEVLGKGQGQDQGEYQREGQHQGHRERSQTDLSFTCEGQGRTMVMSLVGVATQVST